MDVLVSNLYPYTVSHTELQWCSQSASVSACLHTYDITLPYPLGQTYFTDTLYSLHMHIYLCLCLYLLTLSLSLTLFLHCVCTVWLVQCLQCGDQDTLVKALKRPPESSLKREGLRAVSLLLRDPRGKVCSAASSLLRSLADQPRHRERVNQLILRITLQHLNNGSVFHV